MQLKEELKEARWEAGTMGGCTPGWYLPVNWSGADTPLGDDEVEWRDRAGVWHSISFPPSYLAIIACRAWLRTKQENDKTLVQSPNTKNPDAWFELSPDVRLV